MTEYIAVTILEQLRHARIDLGDVVIEFGKVLDAMPRVEVEEDDEL